MEYLRRILRSVGNQIDNYSFNPSFTMEYLRSPKGRKFEERQNLFQSFFYNGIPTKTSKRISMNWGKSVSILLLQWNTYEGNKYTLLSSSIAWFQSFFYNGIHTKLKIWIQWFYEITVSILLLQWNTYEAFYYFFFFLIEFVFQSFFYNGIPTKLLEISIPSTLSRVSILLLQWNTYEDQ